jgi:hypothetical protein
LATKVNEDNNEKSKKEWFSTWRSKETAVVVSAAETVMAEVRSSEDYWFRVKWDSHAD